MSGCNCPSMDDVLRHGVGTKPPCPVHDTPEQLAALADVLVPAIPLHDLSFAPFDDQDPPTGEDAAT